MGSNFFYGTSDLDAIFKDRTAGDPMASATGLNAGSTDLNQRFYPSSGASDRITFNTGFQVIQTKTSGALIIGAIYEITSLSGGASFAGVGASSDTLNLVFTATGTTPTWGAGSLRATTDFKYVFRDINAGPTITAQPSGGTRIVGGAITFSTTATGAGTLTYQWRKGGVAISGATSSSYTLSTITLGDAASYDCVVSDAIGSRTSNSVALHLSPSITSNPAGGTRTVGEVLNLMVAATGESTLTYQWRKGATNIPGATGASLTFTTTSILDSANYDCAVSNAFGSAICSVASVTVNDVAPDITGGSVTGGPYPYTVGVNAAVFTVVASGINTTIQWFKDTVAIPGANAATYSLGVVAHPSQGGAYSVTVTNSGGTASASAALTVQDVAIVVNSELSTVDVSPLTYNFTDGANNADFYVQLSAGTNVLLQWYKDGAPFYFYSMTSGFSQGPTYFPVHIADAGTYSIVMTNGQGTVTASAVMNVT